MLMHNKLFSCVKTAMYFSFFLFICIFFKLVFASAGTSAPKLEPKFSTRVQNVGSRFKMLCASQFGDQLRFSWSRNGRPLSLSDSTDDYQHYQIESGQFESSLTIAQVTAKDTGSNFTCTAANQLGMDTMTVLLSVNGKKIFLLSSVPIANKVWRILVRYLN